MASCPSHQRQKSSPSCHLPVLQTDGAYCANPPQWLVLYCLQEAACEGGFTKLVDGFDLLRHALCLEEQKMLMKCSYTFSNRDGTQKIHKPILQRDKGADLLWRYSHNALMFGSSSPKMDVQPKNQDVWLQGIAERIIDFCSDQHQSIRMQTGSLLIWDNHRMLHYRSGFTDSNRHLQRLWMNGRL